MGLEGSEGAPARKCSSGSATRSSRGSSPPRSASGQHGTGRGRLAGDSNGAGGAVRHATNLSISRGASDADASARCQRS